jgi:hypothetical protein
MTQESKVEVEVEVEGGKLQNFEGGRKKESRKGKAIVVHQRRQERRG